MTAVSRCSDRWTQRWWSQGLVALLCCALVWTPWALAWGDDIRAAANAGRSFGSSQAWSVTPQDWSAGDFSHLFPQQQGGLGGLTALYGDDEATIWEGQAWQRELLENDSFQAEAYRALRGPLNRSRPDFTNDPIWANTDYVLNNFSAITEDFGDCETITRFTQGESQAKIPSIQVCEVLPDLSRACLSVHDYDLPTDVGLIPTNWGWGEPIDCTWFEVDRIDNQIAQLSNELALAGPFEEFALQQQIDQLQEQRPAAVARAQTSRCMHYFTSSAHQDKTLRFRKGAHSTIQEVQVSAYRHCGNPFRRTMNLTSALRNGGAFDFFTFWDVNYIHEWVTHPDWIAAGRDPYCGGNKPQYNVHVWFTNTMLDRGWSNEDCLRYINQISEAGICKPPVANCLRMPELDAQGCIGSGFARLCPGGVQHSSPIPGISPLCQKATYEIDCENVTAGTGTCWTDPNGIEQCLTSDGTNVNNCQLLEDDPNCGYLREQCVGGASDRYGNCFVIEQVWDCGRRVGIPTLSREQEHQCSGPVRCMGEDCVDFPEEQSEDFAKAVAALQALQMMVLDMECSGSDCVIFSGTAEECKKAVGGIVNCCKSPEDRVSLREYISLILLAGKIENAMGLGVGDKVRGTWEVLSAPVNSMWSSIQQSFTSAANSLTGSTTAAATDAAGSGVLTATKQKLMNGVAQWTSDIFGQAAAETLFQNVGGGPAIGAGGALTGDVMLANFLTTAMQAIMWAYMIYNVAMLLIRLIWTCEEDELELAAKRELKSCHFVGGYCKDEVLGWCVEKRDAYCCFSTPIARILNEQIRPQIGRGWGEAEYPDCRGIRVSSLSRVDWSRVDLSEWLALLMDSGNFPTADTLNIEDLTGGGHPYAAESRPNVVARTSQRLSNVDIDEAREEASDEVETRILPAVPAVESNNP